MPINPGYILYHDNEKIVIRNYEGKIFEYPETGNENVQFAPQREYHDEYSVFLDRINRISEKLLSFNPVYFVW